MRGGKVARLAFGYATPRFDARATIVARGELLTSLWPPLAAPLLNGAALVLALGFRRNRAVLVLAVLTLAACAATGLIRPEASEHGSEATRMFAPWLLLAAAALPERGLLAARNLVLLSTLLLAAWLTLAAPDSLWIGLRQALPLGGLPWSSGTVAAALTAIAALACLVRWIVVGTPIEAGLGIVLAVTAVALLPSVPPERVQRAFVLTGIVGLSAILYASYRLAFVDALTGLPNRRALDETLQRLTGHFALAMVDVDHFKQFNDLHGHDAGDRVLATVAQQLRRSRGSHAFRYGGEEFCLLFTGARCREAAQACEALRARVAALRVRIRSAPPVRRAAQATRRSPASEVQVTVSIGLAYRDGEKRSPGEVLKAADQALYKAKAKGRNRVVTR